MSRQRWFDLAVAIGSLVLAGIFAMTGDSWLVLAVLGLVSLYFFWKASRPDPPKWTTEGLTLNGPRKSSHMTPPGIPGHSICWMMVDIVPLRSGLEPPYELRLRCSSRYGETKLREVIAIFCARPDGPSWKLDEPDSAVTGGRVEINGNEIRLDFKRPNLEPPAFLRLSICASYNFELEPVERRVRDE